MKISVITIILALIVDVAGRAAVAFPTTIFEILDRPLRPIILFVQTYSKKCTKDCEERYGPVVEHSNDDINEKNKLRNCTHKLREEINPSGSGWWSRGTSKRIKALSEELCEDSLRGARSKARGARSKAKICRLMCENRPDKWPMRP